MMFYLYSMEPPLYADLNKASKEKNPEILETLGPFARCFYKVLSNIMEFEAKRDDPLRLGKQDENNLMHTHG